MSTIQRVAKNAIALYLSYIINALLSLVLSIAIARELGDADFGKYSFAMAFTMLFAVVLDFGLNTVIVMDVAPNKSLASKYMGNIIIIKAILSFVTFGFLALIITLMDYPHDTTTMVFILGFLMILRAFADIFRVNLRAFEIMEYEAIVLTTSQLITISLALAVLFLGYGLIEIVSTFIIGGIFDLVLSFAISCRKSSKPKLEIDLDFWKKVIKVAIPLGSLSLVTILFNRTDTVMLSILMGDEGDVVVGWYNAAYNLVSSLHFIPTIFLTAIFPIMSIFSISSPNALKISCEKSLQYLFILGLPIAAGTTILADRIILLTYGDQFTASTIALQIFAWGLLMFFCASSLGWALGSMRKQNQIAIFCWLCAIINIILNLILIQPFSYKGAAIATIITRTLLFISYYYLVSKYLYRLPLQKIFVKPLVACAIMATFTYFCCSINLPLLICLSAVIYIIALYMMKTFTEEDKNILKQLLNRRGFIGNNQ